MAADVVEQQPREQEDEPRLVDFTSGVDGLLGLAQAKMAFQRLHGDHAGAEATNKRFWVFSLGASQLASLQECYHGNVKEAWLRQKQFADGAGRMLKAIPESMPILGHLVGGVHCCVGNRDHGRNVLKRASRSCFVCAPGLVIGGASIALGITPSGLMQHGIMTAAAGIGGVAAGMQADVRLFLRAIPPQVSMSPGERFDMFVLRGLDALKSVTCMDIVPILYPDSIEQASVWVEPLNGAEAAHLMTGIKQWPMLEKLDTGALHSFVVLKTSKGHLLLTERLHDGQIVLGDTGQTAVSHFADGQFMVSNGSRLDMSPMAERLMMARDNGATLYAVKEIVGGPTAASLSRFAEAQSTIGYDLLTSNCQHYANSVLEFTTGKGLTYLPNADMLALSSMIMPPVPTAPFSAAGFLGTVAYEGAQVPARVAADAAFICCPRQEPQMARVLAPEQLQQLPLAELQRELEQMPLGDRERLPAAQLQQLTQAAAAQVAGHQMQGHRMSEEAVRQPAAEGSSDSEPMVSGTTERLIGGSPEPERTVPRVRGEGSESSQLHVY